MQYWTFWGASAASVLLVSVLLAMKLLSREGALTFDANQIAGKHRRLVVMAHGLGGAKLFAPAVELAKEALPDSDFLVFAYDVNVLSNSSPYELANAMEQRIDRTFASNSYEEIVLIGHSMGGMLLRKVVVWGNGIEDDRRMIRSGSRPWVRKVTRFVSLASINRGWSVDPKPQKMRVLHYVGAVIGQRLARLSGSGKLLLALERGAPFVADLRVQWIRLCRGDGVTGATRAPTTIHLLGDLDDVVAKDDAADIGVAKATTFVVLDQTNHVDIAAALEGAPGSAAAERRGAIRHAMQGKTDSLRIDKTQGMPEDPAVEHLVYVMHGIRDYGNWSDALRPLLEQEAAVAGARVAVVSAKYGHYPMGPFLLYWDRQRNVRWFMDEFTENMARYPNVQTIDFVGHSNGTYILASALQRYSSLKVNRVYFAGSVVPKHYPWQKLIDTGRVQRVANVVAASDWVVAIFPRFFEQLAEWANRKPVDGLLDLGSAGFRGFDASQDPSQCVVNYKFADGNHGVGVQVSDATKAAAISGFIVRGDASGLQGFQNRSDPDPVWDIASNVSWLLWIGLVALAVSLCYVAFGHSGWAGAAAVVLVLGLLTSV